MAEKSFFEIILNVTSFDASDSIDREDIEDALEEALQAARMGEVTGAGAGMGKIIIDIEVDGSRMDEAIELMRRTLQLLSLPEDTRIRGPGPEERHVIYR
ncbi:hypothetical protein [Deinococcus sp. QL22]|uniref:hypothetical protein n=1 Tax=Deinococcus sp. QL22 TaxID=2939437 RepID=UPI002017DDBE|nr:hypothetical protein [Deinococcus sp. QL22]UQN06251.1 hypothetical protein M1R55_15540 [Deinococcus sp. QL22]